MNINEILKQITIENNKDSLKIINNRIKDSILVKEKIILPKKKLSSIYYLYDCDDNLKYTIKQNKLFINKYLMYDKDNNKICKLIRFNKHLFYNNKLIKDKIDIKEKEKKDNKSNYIIYYKGINIINILYLDYLNEDIYTKYLLEIKDNSNEVFAILLAIVIELDAIYNY